MQRAVRPLAIACIALATLVPGADAWAARTRPITHEDVWLMKRVGQPALSPDGQWVAFSVVEPAYDEKDQWSDLWVAATDGTGEPRRLTSTRRPESGAAWSPDSKRLAFSTRREDDEVEQIYIMDVASGGEAQRITQLATGARAPKWRPDGDALLFASDVFPRARTDADNRKTLKEHEERKYTARVYDAAPIRHWDRWLDDRRPSLFVQALDSGGTSARGEPRNLLAGTELFASPGYGGRLENEGDLIDAAWTPDGRSVVFAATANRNEWAYAETVLGLWIVPARGGEPQRLTSDAASYEAPVFSRDGRALYAAREAVGERVYNAKRVARLDWPAAGKTMRVVTPAFDRSVTRFEIAPDGASLYLLAEDSGLEKLYQMPANGGAVREVGSLTAGCHTNVVVAGEPGRPVIVSRWESAVHPPEVGRIDPASGRWTALTRVNAERVAQIDWEPVRPFWFTSSTGKRIHNLLALPPKFDASRKYPLFVLIHGGPHTMWRDQFFVRWNYHLLAAPGYVLLLTNYSGSTGFGEAFAQSIQGDPLAGPGRELNEAADAAIREFSFIDATRQAAGGASYGGHLTNWLAVTTDRYRALVSHAGLFDLKTQWSTSDLVYSRERNMGGPVWEGGAGWREQSPIYRASQLRTPMLLTIGERDYRVPINNTFELWTALQRQKVPSRLVVFPDENHWITHGGNSRFFYDEVHRWLKLYLAEDGAPPRTVVSR
jgi:dipeptidyl aminopeptidase/acylaminoacyl peptidase